jgi:hypothetical protein
VSEKKAQSNNRAKSDDADNHHENPVLCRHDLRELKARAEKLLHDLLHANDATPDCRTTQRARWLLEADDLCSLFVEREGTKLIHRRKQFKALIAAVSDDSACKLQLTVEGSVEHGRRGSSLAARVGGLLLHKQC